MPFHCRLSVIDRESLELFYASLTVETEYDMLRQAF